MVPLVTLLLKPLNSPAVKTIWGMQWLLLKGLVKSGQWTPAKIFVILEVICKMGFHLKHGKNFMSVMTVTLGTMHSFLRKNESVNREQMGWGGAGDHVIQ